MDNQEKGKSSTPIDRVVESYNRLILRSLIQAVAAVFPYASVVGTPFDMWATKRYEEIRADRLTTFYDELAKGEKVLSEDLINSEDFLHHHFATVTAVLKTRHRKKIQWFARLLLAAVDSESSIHSCYAVGQG